MVRTETLGALSTLRQASAVQVIDAAGAAADTESGTLGGPSGQCCVRQVNHFDPNDVSVDPRAPAGVTKAKVVFQCRSGNKCPVNWRAVHGHFCSKGFEQAIIAQPGTKEKPQISKGFDKKSSCDAAVPSGTDNTDDDDNDKDDNKKDTRDILMCCVKVTTSSLSTRTKFQCKTRKCGSSWEMRDGQFCKDAFRIANEATDFDGSINEQHAFCENFDGTDSYNGKYAIG
jgi:hypothetical protein